jgi:2-succinyl-5-enolpyruvyl-6-hydroxy-3-cyclohexene-1-carboxylate synthase
LDEPLYDPLPEPSNKLLKPQVEAGADKGPVLPDEFLSAWEKAGRIMIIHGHSVPNELVTESLQKLTTDSRIVIIGENISNCASTDIISNPEHLLANYSAHLDRPPDLLIYSAGQVVSKRLKSFLRNITIKNTYRIGFDDYPIDTFRQNNRSLQTSPGEFYSSLSNYIQTDENTPFKTSWMRASVASRVHLYSLIEKLPFCDLTAFSTILKSIPPGTLLELGNSSVIRYSQLFQSRTDMVYYSNRGVSGIDGCLSAACGTAYHSEKLTVSILGDLSFIYDSNALWNKHLPENLRIFVINNSGGDIFNLIEGVSRQPTIATYLRAHHPVSIQKLAEAFNLDYFCGSNESDLNDQKNEFLTGRSKAALFEIKTPPGQNSTYFKQAMKKRPDPKIL